jgi:hypothetical protein
MHNVIMVSYGLKSSLQPLSKNKSFTAPGTNVLLRAPHGAFHTLLLHPVPTFQRQPAVALFRAGLSKSGVRLQSLWQVPESYYAQQKKEKRTNAWYINVSHKINIKSVRELCVLSHCVFLKISYARIPHERGAPVSA